MFKLRNCVKIRMTSKHTMPRMILPEFISSFYRYSNGLWNDIESTTWCNVEVFTDVVHRGLVSSCLYDVGSSLKETDNSIISYYNQESASFCVCVCAWVVVVCACVCACVFAMLLLLDNSQFSHQTFWGLSMTPSSQ